MANARWHLSTLLLTLILLCGVAERDRRPSYDTFPVEPYMKKIHIDEKYLRNIHSMYDAFRADMSGRVLIETNSLIDAKYRAWKRNADFINSLLAIPKGLNDAGR